MRTLVRHRRRAALRRWRTRRTTTSAVARFITYRAGRVNVPDYIPDSWLAEPTMNYAVVTCVPSDPWAAYPMFAGWGAR